MMPLRSNNGIRFKLAGFLQTQTGLSETSVQRVELVLVGLFAGVGELVVCAQCSLGHQLAGFLEQLFARGFLHLQPIKKHSHNELAPCEVVSPVFFRRARKCDQVT